MNSAMTRADSVVQAATALLQEIKDRIQSDELKYSEANYIVHRLREAEGYLISCRKLTTPGEPL
jgi:hypothetical protein